MLRFALALFPFLFGAAVATAEDDRNCFPLESLPGDVRRYAEYYLSNALRSSAIYTLAGPLKPVTDGFATYLVPRGTSAEGMRRVFRTLAEAWQCDGRYELTTHLGPPDEDGDRRLSLYLAHRESFRDVIRRRPALFKRLTLMPSDSLEHVIYLAETAQEPIRSEALGALYGYPYEATQFFARNKRRMLREQEELKRRHVRIVGVDRTAEFVYTVDANAPVSKTERQLRHKSARIRGSYRRVVRKLTTELGREPLPQELLRRWIATKPELFPGANCATTLTLPEEQSSVH